MRDYFKGFFSQKGQISVAIVFFILATIGIFSLSLLYRIKLENEATLNFCDAIKAEYLAWAGIERAIAELKNDKNHYDDLYEDWAKGFKEDLGEGYYDVKLLSDDGEIKDVGIVDEASKININVAGDGSFNEGYSPSELNLSSLKGLNENKAKAIIQYRLGEDGAPGRKGVDDDGDAEFISKDGIDNDADGEVDEEKEGIDEPDEFCPENPFGDDNPFETVQELRTVPWIGDYTFNEIKDRVTIFSYDKNIDRDGSLRVNINCAPPRQIFLALKKAGFSDGRASQIAVNIVDFRDEDSDPTEFNGKYGIEQTPYINEVMPNFTTSVVAACIDLAKGGVRYLKDKAKEEVKRKLKEKVKKDVPFIDEVIDDAASKGEKELEKAVERILEKYTRLHNLKKKKPSGFTLFGLFKEKPAFAEGDAEVKIEIQIEWVELYNPYPEKISCTGWKIKTSLRERKIFGFVFPQGYWVIFNVVIKMPGKTIGKELLDNFSDEVKLINSHGKVVDAVSYENYGVPWRAWEKNDPRVREFAGYILGGSPWFKNFYFMPEIGGEVTSEDYESSFYVKNRSFSSIGEVGYIHRGSQWQTVNLKEGGDWRILDRITTSFPPEKPVKGRININTAASCVLQSLPLVDLKLAEQIIAYCDSKDGPFDEIGEIACVRGIQKLGFNGWDDDGDGWIDEDDEKEAILRKISNLITVRSNCFTIVSLGKVVRGGKTVAEKKIKVVVDRGKSPVKILYYREISSD